MIVGLRRTPIKLIEFYIEFIYLQTITISFRIDDPYLLLYLSSFLDIGDFIKLSQTSRLFTDDPLITDEIKKRITNNTSAECFTIRSSTVKIYNSGITTTSLVFPINSVPVVEFIQNVPSERVTFNINTPYWRFQWSGVLFNNDVTDLSNTSFLIHVAKTSYASLDILVFRDDTNLIYLDEIRFRIAHNIPQRLARERRQRYVSTVSFVIFTFCTICGSNEFAVRVELFVLAFVIVYYMARDASVDYNLIPIQTEHW